MRIISIVAAFVIAVMVLSTGAFSPDAFAQAKRHRRSSRDINSEGRRVQRPALSVEMARSAAVPTIVGLAHLTAALSDGSGEV